MEDLWVNPNLRKFIQEKYPRAYIEITGPMREFGLYKFIKIAEAQNLDNKINELAGTATRKLKKVQSIKSI